MRALLAVVLAASAAAADEKRSLDAVFEKVDPAVVTVRVAMRHLEGDDVQFRLEVGYGTGAGVVLHEAGFVATAAHVVEEAEQIQLEFKDGSKSEAHVVTLSRTEDIALLKADRLPKGTVAPPLADSEKVRVGQLVFAVGTPQNYPHTMSAGVVSSVRHDAPRGLTPGHVIQTDAALNPGNSGGPLFNEKGEVVGIASFIFSKSGGSEGLGFAIPSNVVRRRLFDRPLPYLGVSLRIIPEPVMQLFNWPYPGGILVEQVRAGSPGAQAGLQGGVVEALVGESRVRLGGDLIIKVGPHDAWKTEDIGNYLAGLKAGEKIEYRVMRKGALVDVAVPVPERELIPTLGPPLVAQEEVKRVNSISSATALWVIECVRRRGKPVRPLLELAGIDPTKLPAADQHIAAERYVELWQRAVQLTADPAFPLECGAAFDVEALGVFGFLAISCETLGDAYARTAAVRDLYNVGASWDLEPRGAVLRLIWNPWPLKKRSPAMNEYQVTEMLTSTRQMTRKRLVPVRVSFTHSAPADLAPYRKVFGVAPGFGADFCGFEFDPAWLELPLQSRNPRLRDYFEKQCAQVQAAFARDPPFAAQVRRRLTESMNGERLGMREIAKALAVTERTLQRRLTEEGTGFNALLDEVRREFAERYLARENLALAEVAWLTGFNDASSFFKAFRRWTGATPGEWRARVG